MVFETKNVIDEFGNQITLIRRYEDSCWEIVG